MIKRLVPPFLMLVALLFLSGCSATSIYVPTGQAVQLREDVKNAKVWVKTEQGTEPAVMNLPNGWYCLSGE